MSGTTLLLIFNIFSLTPATLAIVIFLCIPLCVTGGRSCWHVESFSSLSLALSLSTFFLHPFRILRFIEQFPNMTRHFFMVFALGIVSSVFSRTPRISQLNQSCGGSGSDAAVCAQDLVCDYPYLFPGDVNYWEPGVCKRRVYIGERCGPKYGGCYINSLCTTRNGVARCEELFANVDEWCGGDLGKEERRCLSHLVCRGASPGKPGRCDYP